MKSKKKGMKNLSEPDYKGFVEHVWEWEENGYCFGTRDLIKLAHKYHTPIPDFAITGEELIIKE